MAAICFYFQVHQPFRLKDYSFFKIGNDHNYGATQQNFGILSRVADNCYLPTNEILLKMLERGKGRFKVSFSLTGTVIDQLEHFRPDVLESFQALAKTGHVEFIGETYNHSLAAFFSRSEFERQVEEHAQRIQELFGQRPVTFRNTELTYVNGMGSWLSGLGYKALITEGVERCLPVGTTNVGQVFNDRDREIDILLRHAGLSDDIAFRLPDKTWDQWPLTPQKFCEWLNLRHQQGDEYILLGMDYETFGEHRTRDTGIFDFLEGLPAQVYRQPDLYFATMAEISNLQAKKAEATAMPVAADEEENTLTVFKPVYSVVEPISWADTSRSLSAWTSDRMQQDALKKCYALEPWVNRAADAQITQIWGRLQTSDHFYYMSTKYWSDPVHRGFSPYKSPYDAYINYMNVLSDFSLLIGAAGR